MRKTQAATEEQSMIPAIQEVEGRCRQMLEQAREKAAEEVRAAERESEEAVRQAAEQLPLAMDRRHQEEVARLQAGLPARGREPEELARRAALNLERAVAAIVSKVWADGR
jgi:hypothetical protein